MKHRCIAKSALFGALTFALAQPALAVTDEEFNELKEQFNLLADQVEESSNLDWRSTSGSKTTLGGYGELHYNNLSNGQGDDLKLMDFHRFVLFVNHEFNDDTRFFSELEVEHTLAGANDPGEVSIEQALVQFDLSDNTNINAGIMLIPVGIINLRHEPPTFYGVERNVIEKYIIPTTWAEGGAMLSGHYSSGFSYDAALTTGLDSGTNIRGGRQKVANANASNLAATGRVRYTGTPGLELSATAQYQDDMTQDTSDDIGSATLLEGHVRWNVANITLTALYAQWNIDVKDTADAIDKAKDVQNGGYLEASYKITPKWGVFARQNEWDNGGAASDTAKSQTDLGFNYWPHENVVLKADYQIQNDVAGNFDGFNLGVGYQF